MPKPTNKSKKAGRVDAPFDALEYKRRVQASIYEQTRDMTHEQEIEFYRKSIEQGPLARFWKRLTNRSASQPTPGKRTPARRRSA